MTDSAAQALRAPMAIAIVIVLGAAAYLLATRDHVPSESLQAERPGPTDVTKNDSPELTLPEEDRQYLWDVEHQGTVLGKYGFGPFKQALAEGDAEQLLALLAEDFTGGVPEGEPGASFTDELLTASRIDGAEGNATQLDATGFVEWLMEQRQLFSATPQAKASLMSLRPESKDEFGGRWQGSFRLRLWGDDGDAEPAEMFIYLSFTSDQPTEERLQTGAWLRSCRVTRVKRAHSTKRLLVDVAAELGIDVDDLWDNWKKPKNKAVSNTGGVYLADYNRDGLVDMLVTDMSRNDPCCVLYEGTAGGKFVDATYKLILPQGPPTLVGFVDVDGDGWEDLLVAGRILRNLEGKRFKDMTPRSNLRAVANLKETYRNSLLTVVDYDLDGRMDLYVSRPTLGVNEGSWVGGATNDQHRNQLLRNVGDWQFEDVTAQTGTDGGGRSVFSSVWTDVNDDRRPDLYVIHEFGNGLLYVNQAEGRFREVPVIDQPADFGSMGVTCGDFNNDGRPDIYVASMYTKSGTRVIGNLREDAYDAEVMQKLRRMVTGNQMYRNDGDLKFTAAGTDLDVTDVGWAYGPTMADLNNDGWLDIYCTAGFISRTREKPDG